MSAELPEVPQSARCIEPSSREIHAMALEGLMLATQVNMQRLQEAEQQLFAVRRERVKNLQALRRRKKRAALIGRKGNTNAEVREIITGHRTQRDEVQKVIDTYLLKIEEFRALFVQQVEDTAVTGYADLSQEWTARFLEIDTPFDRELIATPIGVRQEHTKDRRVIAAIWTNIRAAIQKAISGGEKIVPVFTKHMREFDLELQHRSAFLVARRPGYGCAGS